MVAPDDEEYGTRPGRGRGTVPRCPLRQGWSGPASNLGGSETDFKKGVCHSRRPPDPAPSPPNCSRPSIVENPRHRRMSNKAGKHRASAKSVIGVFASRWASHRSGRCHGSDRSLGCLGRLPPCVPGRLGRCIPSRPRTTPTRRAAAVQGRGLGDGNGLPRWVGDHRSWHRVAGGRRKPRLLHDRRRLLRH